MVIEFSPISLDCLEDLLGVDYEEYEEGLYRRRSENFCAACREQYKKRWGKQWPLCEGSVDTHLKNLEERGMSKDEAMYTKTTMDPVMWAGVTLNWYADWYQSQYLRCSSLAKVCRWGRRLGKTDSLCVDMLHKALTRPGKKEYEAFTVLVITPYEAQVDRIFGVLRNMIDRNASVRESVLADIKNPQSISFTNKSIIKGFTSGVKSGNKSEKIRGEDADAIYLDESDLLTKDDLEAILAIRASHPACTINFSTTPTGKRETFHEVCTIKDLGFKEFWRVSHESPRYTEETDTQFRKMYTFGGYQREMLAMFGEEAEGVFQKKYVDAAIGTYEMHECIPNKDRMYLMGVDWNDHIHGTHIVINEYDPETEAFKVVAKDIIKGGEYTQLKSIDRIVELNQRWEPHYIGLDAGYGSTNEELLKIIGAKYPQTGLKEKMFAYNMSSKVIVKDAITGADLKKHIKPLMVEWSVQIMERGLQKFPASEDSKKGKGLVHQVRSYRKERVSPDGRPVYSQGYDHTLTAWNLTLLVFMLNETEFANSSRDVQFTRSGSPSKGGNGNNQGNEIPKKQLRLFGANRGGIVPDNQTVRSDLKSMRKALRPTKRSNF